MGQVHGDIARSKPAPALGAVRSDVGAPPRPEASGPAHRFIRPTPPRGAGPISGRRVALAWSSDPSLAAPRVKCNDDSGEADDKASSGEDMRDLRRRSPRKTEGDAGEQATFDCGHARTNVRRTLVLSLMCLPYAVLASVIWAAYHELEEQSPPDRAPLIAGDQTPFKLVPSAHDQDHMSAPGWPGADRTVNAASAPPVSRVSDVSPLAIRPSEPEGQSSTGSVDEAERAAFAELQDAFNAWAGRNARSLEKATIPEPQESTAASQEMRFEALAATPLVMAAVSAAVRDLEFARASLPEPALKPLDASAVTIAATTSASESFEATPLDIARTAPPTPSLKPILMPSRERPERRQEGDQRDARQIAATDQSLPEALRALWTNLKILLASGPAPSAIRARGGDDRDNREAQSRARAERGSASGGNGVSTSVGSSRNDGSGGGNSGPGTSGGGNSDSNSGSGGGGGGSTNGGGSSANGGGNTGDAASSGGSNGRGASGDRGGVGSGRGDGDRGSTGGGVGRGGNDDRGGRGNNGRGGRSDNDRGGRSGNDRGDRGDNDRGGRGDNDRGGRDRD